MTETNNPQAHQLIVQAYRAVRLGHNAVARQLAESAASLAPNLEEPYLLLAAISDPRTAMGYLKKALEINPSSQRARNGMQWAIQKLRSSQQPQGPAEMVPPAPANTPAIPASPEPVQAAEIPTVPVTISPVQSLDPKVHPDRAPAARMQPAAKKAVAIKRRPFILWATTAVVLVCLVALAWVAWPFIMPVFARSNSAARPAAVMVKPSLTPSNTPTTTFTFTPTPTDTATPTSTFTPTTTNTPTATNTPLPSDTPAPTKTKAPTLAPQSGSMKIPPGITESQKWVDVDLTKQRAYAYQGSTLVRSFLISSGVARFPTVTGQFHVYVKYRYALMTGPGYYLPRVPYTMYFYQSYGLHGTYWHHNFGHPMSHGCVNLKTEDAQWLYENWVVIGTLVNIHY
ncbi:MAG TPA: L,D-transpeptidase family protein [Anaerolineaceae bacterium]|nr:L,D-transpeptidase family protein [Anaerolineaceae bacterium]